MSDDEYGDEPRQKTIWTEFDCPECSANNPFDEGFRHNDELVCQYCGLPWRVKADGDGGFRLQEA